MEELQKEIQKLKSSIKKKKFGLVWMDVPDEFEKQSQNAMSVLKEVPEKAVVNDDGLANKLQNLGKYFVGGIVLFADGIYKYCDSPDYDDITPSNNEWKPLGNLI